MAFQQYFVQEWAPESDKPSSAAGCFDCSICLDFACDPVVTLCGHLYCWACIYKWFDSQTGSEELPQCPVCKSEISQKAMVPLYGRGQSLPGSEIEGKVIPPRPQACGIKGLTDTFHHSEEQHQIATTNGHYQDSESFPTNAGTMGEMVYARVFRNSQSLYTYPNSYHAIGSSSPRLRRQQQQVDRSLHRVSVFLLCFSLLCLLVF